MTGKGSGSTGNNTLADRQKAAKDGKCQWCGTKVPLKEQYVVFNDFETQTTKMVKGADKAVHEKRSHGCKPCATKRQAQKQKGDFNRDQNKVRTAKAKKSAAKKAAKPAPKKAVKRTVKRKPAAKRTRKVSAKDPF